MTVPSSRVVTTEDWRAEHAPHLRAANPADPDAFDFAIRRTTPHDWFFLCCPCGAQHLTTDTPGRLYPTTEDIQ